MLLHTLILLQTLQQVAPPLTVNFSVTTPQPGVNYSWNFGDGQIGNGTNITYVYNNQDYPPLTHVTLSASNNCGATQTSKSISIFPNPIVGITQSSVSICPGQSATFTASGTGDQYLWSTGDDDNILTVNPTTSNIYNYTVTVTDSKSCTSTATATLTVSEPNVSIVTNNGITSICEGNKILLRGKGPKDASYTWSTSQTSQNITVSPTILTNYTVTATTSLGCTGTADILIEVNPKPVISFTTIPLNATICPGESATINANSTANQYSWSNSSTTSTISVTPTTNTTYTVTATINSTFCSNTSSKLISVVPKPAPIIIGTQNTCAGLTNIYSVNQTSEENYSWIITGGIPTIASGNYVPVTWSPTGGTITVTATNAGCSTTSAIKTVLPCPCYNNVVYCNDPAINSFGNIDVSGNVVWKPKWIKPGGISGFPCASPALSFNFSGNILIKPGGSLTIEGISVFFSPESKIILEASTITQNGGKLVLDNTRLSAVGSCMWKGVEVNGKSNSTTTAPGIIYVRNNSIIEHASIGIITGPTKSGGRIIASGASFINNYIGISIQPFTYPINDLLVGSCKFICDATLRDKSKYGPNGRTSVFIEINRARLNCKPKSVIYKNDFYNSPNNVMNSTYGIHSFDSYCDATENNFDNLYRGIYAEQSSVSTTSGNWGFIYNTFKHISGVGIYISNGLKEIVKYNTITLSSINSKTNSAIMLENCTNIKLNNNIIDSYMFGIVILNLNQTFDNNILKNQISNSQYAISLGGTNKDLKLYCNDLSVYSENGL